MKQKNWILLVLMGTMGVASCHSDARYLDLNTGEYVNLKKDDSSGAMVNATTGKPVAVYVDTKTKDTLYGATGEVVNGKVVKTKDGQWKVKQDGEEFKAASGDEKYKSEGEDTKVKDGNYTRKTDGDGDVKIEDGNKTVKIDGETGERKVKKDRNITDKVKKIFH